MIAALYTALSYLTQYFQVAFFQIRVSEALCVMPLFFPEAAPALFVGCIFSNLLSACLPVDTVFGSVATLIGALGALMLAKIPERYKWLATLPTILANAAIIPPILIFAYGSTDSYPFLLATVLIGELLSAGVLGSLLYYALKKTGIFNS